MDKKFIDVEEVERVIRNDVPLKLLMTSSINVAIKNGIEIAEIIKNNATPAVIVEFPYAVGDVIYRNVFGTVTAHTVLKVLYEKSEDSDCMIYHYECGSTTDSFYRSEVGKTVFFTKEEAEQALREREQNECQKV